MERVLKPIFPDEKQMKHYLYRMARSLAGEVSDKLWHICIGERNCGKGVLGDLLKLAFQGFVETFNTESLLCNKMPNADAAKAQSWLSSLEFVRIGIANEVKMQGGGSIMDGNMIKRMTSGGDLVQTRTNYKDEVNKRLQFTPVINANDVPLVEPPDAYQTLEVFSFPNAFVPAADMLAKGNACPRHWRREDPTIKMWCTDPDVIDAFTLMVLDSYAKAKLAPPDCVSNHTKQFKGASAERDIDRLAEIVKYDPRPSSKVFLDEISLALGDVGFKLSDNSIRTYVHKLYGDNDHSPVYGQYMKSGVRAYGFNHIVLNEIKEFNRLETKRAENLRRSEMVRQQVRNQGMDFNPPQGRGAGNYGSELGKRGHGEIE
jgi:hypothetical protein